MEPKKTWMVSLHAYVLGFFLLLFISMVQIASGRECPTSVVCGEAVNVSFPFTTASHPDCGIFVIHGCEDEPPGARKSIQNNGRWFDIVSLNGSTIIIQDDDLTKLLLSRSCEVLGYNFTFTVNSPFVSADFVRSTYMLRCNHALNGTLPNIFSNSTTCGNHTFYETISPPQNSDYRGAMDYFSGYTNITGCTFIELPFGGSVISEGLNYLSNDEFADEIPIQVKLTQDCSHCYNVNRGQCRSDKYGNFDCYIGKTNKKIGKIAVPSAIGALGVLLVLVCCLRRRFFSTENTSHQIIESILNDHGLLAAKRYSYLDVKKATNSFKEKLGKGGFGSVYKGKLPDGTLVAVKVLNESKGNGEEFINEVASICVASHVNIVQLLGFCLQGSKRALIYKYMPNGSVEKFIYEHNDPLKINLQLTCKAMYKIAIGVARGLDYLHKGCNSKIVHFDIKPHNILLDEDFCPKISDFGLAKICKKKESIVSLLGARGTIGYIAPEVFSRNFGGISHKSDVYSYGMMILEMIGKKKITNIEDASGVVESSSEIYFPHWIYKHLEQNQVPEMRCIKTEADKRVIQKMIIVSIWCIQTDPSIRPTMSKVVDMMESNLENLQMPPKPYLSSPPRSPPKSSSSDPSSYSNLE